MLGLLEDLVEGQSLTVWANCHQFAHWYAALFAKILFLFGFVIDDLSWVDWLKWIVFRALRHDLLTVIVENEGHEILFVTNIEL